MSCSGELAGHAWPRWSESRPSGPRADLGLRRADELPQNVQMATEELIHLMTIMYMAIQEALDDPEGTAGVREKLRKDDPIRRRRYS